MFHFVKEKIFQTPYHIRKVSLCLFDEVFCCIVLLKVSLKEPDWHPDTMWVCEIYFTVEGRGGSKSYLVGAI